MRSAREKPSIFDGVDVLECRDRPDKESVSQQVLKMTSPLEKPHTLRGLLAES